VVWFSSEGNRGMTINAVKIQMYYAIIATVWWHWLVTNWKWSVQSTKYY